MYEPKSQLNRRNERAARFSDPLLLRLPCGGELFAVWNPAIDENFADEFDKGAQAFGGIALFCPRRDRNERLEPCPRLRNIGRLLAAENRALDEAAAIVKPAGGDTDGHGVGETPAVQALDVYGETTFSVLSKPFNCIHTGSRIRDFLAERARKKRERGKCREDFPCEVEHAADSTTDGAGRKEPAAAAPATDA